jgi:hypothetical protein
MTIYSPIVKYALPTTSISENSLRIIQQPVISSVLSRLGYNKNMPRAIIHASTMYGGVGLLDLFTKQGCSQIQLILAHLRTQKYLHNQIISLLESYQVLAGITTPALENIDPIIYVHSPWTNTVRQFLLQMNATITIPKLQTIQCIRQYDKAIMDSTNLSLYSKSEQEMINACRLFLKVNTLAEITNHQGNRILGCVHDCSVSLEGHPTLHELSESKLQWPCQTRPPRKAILLWKHYLSSFSGKTNYLIQCLGPWTNNLHAQRTWKFVTSMSSILHYKDNTFTMYAPVPSRTRHRLQFTQRNIVQHT